MIGSAVAAPGNFAIEYYFLHRHFEQCLRDRRAALREAVAREEAHLVLLTECQKPNSIELAFKYPLRSGKPFLSERRRHRLDPFGEAHKRIMTYSTPWR